jgi:hypothetical protein
VTVAGAAAALTMGLAAFGGCGGDGGSVIVPPADGGADAGGAIPLSSARGVGELRGRNGTAFSFRCDAPVSLTSSVWGTGVYTDDSDVCTAAVHAGVLRPALGGVIVGYVTYGRPSYRGSTANGVTTNDYGLYQGSFQFTPLLPSELPPAGARAFAWSDDLRSDRGRTDPILVFCPPYGVAGTVYGSNPFTDDSSVCTAAAFLGLATVDGGGVFLATPGPGQAMYVGGEANGITTYRYGPYDYSFTLSPRR